MNQFLQRGASAKLKLVLDVPTSFSSEPHQTAPIQTAAK